MFTGITTLYRNAYGGLPVSVWLLSLTQLINRSGSMVIFFLAVYLQDELHFSLERTGIVMAMLGAGSFVGVYIGGRLTDSIGYYPVMVGSLLAGGCLFILVGQITSFPILCGAIFLLSAGGDAFRPANMASIAFHSPQELYTRSVSLNRLAINLGFSVGPAVGGILARIDYHYIFWADGLTCFGAALILVLFIRNRRHEQPVEIKQSHARRHHSPFRDKTYLFFLPLASLYAIAFFQFFTTMPLYYSQEEHMNELQIGGIMALNGLIVAAVEMIMIYKIEKKWSPFQFIALGAVLLALSYLSLLLFGGMWWMIIVTVVISFSEMFALPFMNTFMNSRSKKENRGQYASLYVMAWSAAQVATPVIATQIAARSGFHTLWIVLASLAMIVVAGSLLLRRRVLREPA